MPHIGSPTHEGNSQKQIKIKKTNKIKPRPSTTSPPPQKKKIHRRSLLHFRQEQPLVQWLIFRRRPVALHASIADVHSTTTAPQRFDHIRGLLFFWEKVLQHCTATIRMLTFYICRLPLPSKRTDRRHVYMPSNTGCLDLRCAYGGVAVRYYGIRLFFFFFFFLFL